VVIDFSIVPVVLCGGNGTRLWPRSRSARPKPFLSLTGQATLFEATLERVASKFGFASPVIVTGARHVDHVMAQSSSAGATIIVEPKAQNTAAAIALAALRLPEEAVMLVCPSDHHIANEGAFRDAAHAAAALAIEGYLVSIAIEPTWPETGYGYLEQGDSLSNGAFKVERFVEKPDKATAEAYLASGKFSWNGGVFAFRVKCFLDELEKSAPAIAAAARAAVSHGHTDGACFFPAPDKFNGFEPLSVDYAVMERTTKAAMVPAAMGWSDIGNWDALHASLGKDANGNTVQGEADLLDCRSVFVSSDGARVSVVGLEDVIIVVDGNDILVTSRAGAQNVGKLKGAANQ
jgi:mannose-1-phosphate guanylyltransferase